MTPSHKYRALLNDVDVFLKERAYRYFMARYDEHADQELLKVQCDVLALVRRLYLEPHLVWFDEYGERQERDEAVVLVEGDAGMVEDASDAHDEHGGGRKRCS